MLANSTSYKSTRSRSSRTSGNVENYYALLLAILGRKDPDAVRFPATAEEALEYIMYGKPFRGVVAEDFLRELDPDPQEMAENEPEQFVLSL